MLPVRNYKKKQFSFMPIHQAGILVLVCIAIWYLTYDGETAPTARPPQVQPMKKEIEQKDSLPKQSPPAQAPAQKKQSIHHAEVMEEIPLEERKVWREVLRKLDIRVEHYRSIPEQLSMVARKRLSACGITPSKYAATLRKSLNEDDVHHIRLELDRILPQRIRQVQQLLMAGCNLMDTPYTGVEPRQDYQPILVGKSTISSRKRKNAQKRLRAMGIEPCHYEAELQRVIGKNSQKNRLLAKMLIAAGVDLQENGHVYLKAAAAQEDVVKYLREAGALERCEVGKGLAKLRYLGKAVPDLNAKAYMYVYSATWCGYCPKLIMTLMEEYSRMREMGVEVVIFENLLAPDMVWEFPLTSQVDSLPTVEYYSTNVASWNVGLISDENARSLPGMLKDGGGFPRITLVTGDGRTLKIIGGIKNWELVLRREGIL